VKGDTAETIFNETAKLLVLGNLTLPVVKPEHIVALKVFAMKNDPERALREMADIKELLNLLEINLQKVQKYFEKYGQMERYYDIIGEKQKK
jgi:hypothetical protein